MTEEFALCWNNFTDNIINGFSTLLVQGDSLCDVTLAVEGKLLKAHKIVLSLSSPYFKTMFSTNPCQHPIIFLKDMNAKLVQNLLEFIYLGKTNVRQTHLKAFMEVAESLHIKGLSTSQNETKEAIDFFVEKNLKEAANGIKRSKSQSELPEERPHKEPKLEEITDLTEDDCEISINDDSIPIPEVSIGEPRFEDQHFKDIPTGLKITSIVSSANQYDFSEEKYAKFNDYPSSSSCPNTDIVMYSATSLLYDNCIFNRNNIVATQQGLKTYWLCKSYRVNMCKARTITHQGKVISATGTHNHPPHVIEKNQSQHSYNPMPSSSNDFFNHSVPTTSSHQLSLLQPYQPFMQHHMNQSTFTSGQNSRSPNLQHHSPSGSFKMENN